MPPKKRATEAKASPSRLTRSASRVTRSSVKRSHNFLVLPDTRTTNKKARTGKKEGEASGSASVGSERVEGESSGAAAEASGVGKTVVVIEHCKQCSSFTKRAKQVKEALEKSDCDVTVKVNAEKPRKGCFEIREQGGKTFISLLDMKRPFQPMKDLDMEKVISDIIGELSNNS